LVESKFLYVIFGDQPVLLSEFNLSVLQEWTALAEEVVAHEFPSWHLFAAFEVFHLPDSNKVAPPSYKLSYKWG
jgi:hypothetical protein